MAAPGAIKAGAAFVEVFADNSALVRGLAAAEKQVRAFGLKVSAIGRTMMTAGAAIAAPMIMAAKVFSDMGDDIAKMSKRIGISVEALSELGYAARLSGTGADDLEKALKRLSKVLVNLGDMDTEAADDAFKRLGLSSKQLKALSPQDQIKAIADGMQGISDPAERAAIALEIFGKAGTQMLPLLMEGSKGIEAMMKKARDLGLSMSGEQAAAAEAWNDALGELSDVIKMLAFQVGGALAGSLRGYVERMSQAIGDASKWVKAHQGVIVSVAKLAAGLVAGGAAVFVLGKAIGLLAPVLGGVRLAVGAFHAVLSTLVTVIPALISPIGMVALAVGAIGVAFAHETDYIGEATSWLSTAFSTLKDDVKAAAGGIAAAFMAGDIGAAVQVLWTLIKLEFARGINTLKGWWEEWSSAVQGVWIGVVSAFRAVWAGFIFYYRKTVDDIAQWGAEQLVKVMAIFDKDIDVKATIETGRENKVRRDAEGEDEFRKDMERIASKYNEEQGLNDKLHDDRMRQLQEETDAARKKFQDAVQAAKDTAAAAAGPSAPRRITPPGDAVDTALRQTGVVGTFNARAVQSLQGTGPMEKIAQYTYLTSEDIRWIRHCIARNERMGGMPNS